MWRTRIPAVMTERRTGVASLLADRRRNAGLAWALVGVLTGVAVADLLTGLPVLAGFGAATVVLAALPALSFRDPLVMPPWEVVLLAALPAVGRLLSTVRLTGDLATYLSVAALALLVAVQLQVFTSVRMSVGFAIAFVVVATMAGAGLWAVVRWASDVWLGTSLLLTPGVPEAEIVRAVMLEFVYSTVAGALAAVVFELYFRRRAPVDPRIPEEAFGS